MKRSLPVVLALMTMAVSSPSVAAAVQEASTPTDSVAEPGSELRVWLLTAGPGAAVWERFGHNAIRVLDTSTGRDVAYNWGIFDFRQVDFIPRFLKGEMLYMMASFQAGPMVEAYAQTGRRIVMQELDLTPAQRLALRDQAEWNALPENRDYYYDYFLDNCSTRVRDLLNRVLGGSLAERFTARPSGTTWRDQIRRLTADDPLLFTGMDVLLGTPGDRPISVWEEMFLPMTLRDALREVTVTRPDGSERPLVLSEDVLVPGTRPAEAEAPPSWLMYYLLLGAALGAVAAGAGVLARGGRRWALAALAGLALAWSVVAGLVGTILVLVLFTDHAFMFGNENLFLFNPMSLVVVVLLLVAHFRVATRPRAVRAAAGVALVAAAGLALQFLPGLGQTNAIFFALAVPLHLGVWWGLRTGMSGPDAV